jgi:hypothetical protein
VKIQGSDETKKELINVKIIDATAKNLIAERV